MILLLVFALGGLTSHMLSEELTGGDVQSAAKVAGLTFTDSEIELMLPDLESAREDYAANREHEISNGLAPALVFNPILPGIDIPKDQEELRYSSPGQITVPDNRNELAWMTVRELAELIRTRQISSVELTEFFLDRLRTYDDTLHCVVTLTEERALAAARRADAEIARGEYRGLLHGIPYGAKDLLAARGYPVWENKAGEQMINSQISNNPQTLGLTMADNNIGFSFLEIPYECTKSLCDFRLIRIFVGQRTKTVSSLHSFSLQLAV